MKNYNYINPTSGAHRDTLNLIRFYKRILLLKKKKPLYKEFIIPKSNGKKRVINAPIEELKVFFEQHGRTLIKNAFPKSYSNVNDDLMVGKMNPIMAYKKGSDYTQHVHTHKYNKNMVAFDFTDFFPNITPSVILDLAKKQGGNMTFAKMLVQTCTKAQKIKGKWKTGLVQGSPLSPMISNCVGSEFDRQVLIALLDTNVRYTRYADDFILSAPNNMPEFSFWSVVGRLFGRTAVKETMKRLNLHVNEDKTRYLSADHPSGAISIMNLSIKDKMINGKKIRGVFMPQKARRKVRNLIHVSKTKALNVSQFGTLMHYCKVFTSEMDVMIQRHGGHDKHNTQLYPLRRFIRKQKNIMREVD